MENTSTGIPITGTAVYQYQTTLSSTMELYFQVSSDDVSKFKAGQRIPHCSYELQLLPGRSFQRLLHKVAVIGVTSPNSFHIRYPQPEGEPLYNAKRHVDTDIHTSSSRT